MSEEVQEFASENQESLSKTIDSANKSWMSETNRHEMNKLDKQIQFENKRLQEECNIQYDKLQLELERLFSSSRIEALRLAFRFHCEDSDASISNIIGTAGKIAKFIDGGNQEESSLVPSPQSEFGSVRSDS